MSRISLVVDDFGNAVWLSDSAYDSALIYNAQSYDMDINTMLAYTVYGF